MVDLLCFGIGSQLGNALSTLLRIVHEGAATLLDGPIVSNQQKEAWAGPQTSTYSIFVSLGSAMAKLPQRRCFAEKLCDRGSLVL